MASKPYDVVLLPEKLLAQRAIDLSKGLESLGTNFTLDQKSFFPHLSIYMLQLTEEGACEASKRLAATASETKILRIIPNHYNYENEYLDIEYQKTIELSNLQEKVITALSPIRDGLREKDQTRLATAVGEERSNIIEYGYRSVGDSFKPHLTFTRFTEDQMNIISKMPPIETFTGEYPSLALFEMGDHGTCVRLVNLWNLSTT